MREFEAYIRLPGRFGFASSVMLDLPATPTQLYDALEKARVTNERDIYSVGVYSAREEYLPQFIPENANLFELNHLAERLAGLDDWQRSCFEGLTMMDAIRTDYAPIQLERLINMTHSAADCQIAWNVWDDEGLGRFYLENGFYDHLLETMPKAAIPLLSHKLLGEKSRQDEGGVFTPKGYVVLSGEISAEYSSAQLTIPPKPDYVFLLEIATLPEGDEPNDQNCVTIKLPATGQEVENALRQIGTDTINGCCFYEYESTIPALSEAFGFLEDFDELNSLAHTYAGFSPGEKQKFKALLGATECNDLSTAVRLANDIDEYCLREYIAEPADYARAHLKSVYVRDGNDLIERYLSLSDYGAAVMKQQNAVQTPYGALERIDCGPIMLPESPDMGMKME